MKTFTKFGLAAVSATLLALGAASPALAADINVGPGDVAGFENGTAGDAGFNYTQWHIGNISSADAPTSDSLAFNECGVTTLAAPDYAEYTTTQVLLGFDTRPTSTTDVSQLQALIDSISIDVAQGSVTLQLPLYLYLHGDRENNPEFTTFRNLEAFGPGVHTLSGVPLTDSTWEWNDVNSADMMAEFQATVTEFGNVFEILGVGFTGSTDAVVNSISFGGNTYYFGTGDCAPATPTAPTSVQTAAK